MTLYSKLTFRFLSDLGEVHFYLDVPRVCLNCLIRGHSVDTIHMHVDSVFYWPFYYQFSLSEEKKSQLFPDVNR